MNQKIFVVLLTLVHFVKCEWVKIPQITNTPKFTHEVQPVTSSSIFKNSDVMNTVFSYDIPEVISTTTQFSSIDVHHRTETSFPSILTSKPVEFAFEHEVSDKIDYSEIGLESHTMLKEPYGSKKKKVAFVNQTMPIRILLPSNIDSIEETLSSNNGVQHHEMPPNDENVEVTDSKETDLEEEEYYEYEEDISTTTTTKRPSRKSTQKPLQKYKRRKSQASKTKSKAQNNVQFSNFLNFLKSVQESFTMSAAKSITDKIKVLTQFRNKLLLTINRKIKSLWRTKSAMKKTHKKLQKAHSRAKRSSNNGGGWMDHGMGGPMDFPSAEGALLSISFLTFAVFLIKLVLQVIQTIKRKKYSWATNMAGADDISAAANVVIKRNRNVREIPFDDPENFVQILNSIESFKKRYT